MDLAEPRLTAPSVAYLAPRNGHDAALRFFNRKRARLGRSWGALRCFLASRSPFSGRLPYAELLWLPHYLIHIRVRSPKGAGEIAVSVEARTGAFAIFQMDEDLRDGLPEGDLLPASLTPDQAARIGRDRLMETILRRRGHLQKPVPEGVTRMDSFYYPFWVFYYERRPGRVDIKLFDAVRGDPGGPKTKVAVLEAFVERSRAESVQVEELMAHFTPEDNAP